MTERLIHYTPEPFVFEHRLVEQADPATFPLKPHGLWVSVEGNMDWREAAEDMFGTEGLRHATLITLAPDANLLRLTTARDIDRFTEKYSRTFDESLPKLGRSIDWRLVAAEHQGLIVAPYQFSRRLTQHTFWYYGWDCASGCIWDTAAIASVEAIQEVEREEAKRG